MLRFIRVFIFLSAVAALWSCRPKTREIPIRDFFKTPEKSFFKISPDGKYISYLKPFHGKQNLFIQSLADNKEIDVTSFTDYPVNDYFWTFANQLVFSQDLVAEDQFKMYNFDVPTQKARDILCLEKVRIRMLNRNRKQHDIITIATNKRDPGIFDIYRLNIRTGEMQPYLMNPGNFTNWYPDLDGDIRLVKSSDGVNETILYRPDDKTPFKPIIVNNFKNSVEPVAFTGEKNNFYALSNVNRDKTALVEIDAETGKEGKLIYASDAADISRVDYHRYRHRLELVSWEEAKPQKHIMDPAIAGIYNNLQEQLKGYEINIVDRDTSEEKFIVNTYTDRDPGSYYLYESSTKKLSKLADLNSSINPAQLCEMKPVSYRASDGLVINGYLTLPQGDNQTNLPVVVMPHDGPWRRDRWKYSDEVQFLANRGYAVFQMNYRGSTGYGKAFHSAGFKQVGGKIQSDITDGVKWLIDTKVANPKKIAIYGGGFGGFSALYGVSFHPDMYSCAVTQYGLINFFTYIKDAPPFLKPYQKMTYEMVGNPETDADQLRAISPIFHTDKIKVPVLMFQGGKDPSANLSEINQFVRDLKKHDVAVKYFLKPNERKIFRQEHNRVQMYTEIEKFLDSTMRVKR